MVNAWVVPLVLVLLGLVALVAWRRLAPPRRPVWVANTAGVRTDPVVRSSLYQYWVLRTGFGTAIALLAVASAVLLGRPVDRETWQEKSGTRDIVLCLDVSGSMASYDVQIVQKFRELVPYMAGERVALSIFNSTSRTVFPLTDDYAMVAEELAAAASALNYGSFTSSGGDVTTYYDFIAGTELIPDQASLIPDGLVNCALLFDTQPTERSRTIVFATDNEVFGDPLFSLPEATDVVLERSAQVVGLFVGDPDTADMFLAAIRDEFQTEVARTDGLFLPLTSPSATQQIIESITSQQFVDIDTPPRVLESDRTFAWLVLATVALVALFGFGAVIRE